MEGVVALSDADFETANPVPGLVDLERFLADDYARVVVALTAISGDRSAAEDAAAEAVVKGIIAVERGQRIDAWDRWIFVVARNVERNRLRRLVRRRGRAADGVTPDLSTEIVEAEMIREALQALPSRQREVTVLHYYLDLTVAEIGALLGISDGAVKNAMFNARGAIGRVLGPDAEDDA